MYERRLGEKYEGSIGVHGSGLAKLIRADIKAAKAAGDLPADLDVSVRYESFSMGQAIRVSIGYRPDFWRECDGVSRWSEPDAEGNQVGTHCHDPKHGWDAGYRHEVLSDEGMRVRSLVETLHGAYNFDGSESQVDYFDVRYYGQVSLVDRESFEWAARNKIEDAAVKAILETMRPANWDALSAGKRSAWSQQNRGRAVRALRAQVAA